MSEKRHPIRRLFSFVTKAFLLCCVLLGIFTVVGLAAGWVDFNYRHEEETLAIEVNVGKVKRAVSHVFGKDDETKGVSEKGAGNSDAEKSAPKTPPSEPSPDKMDNVAAGTTPQTNDEKVTTLDSESH